MENTEIKPALAAEEWERYLTGRWPATGMRDERKVDDIFADTTGRHSVAALALYGQPFGFTRKDVHAIQRIFFDVPNLDEAIGARLLSLAERIQSLLPPER